MVGEGEEKPRLEWVGEEMKLSIVIFTLETTATARGGGHREGSRERILRQASLNTFSYSSGR